MKYFKSFKTAKEANEALMFLSKRELKTVKKAPIASCPFRFSFERDIEETNQPQTQTGKEHRP